MRTNLAGAGRGIARANVRTLATTVISHSPHTHRMRLERWTMAAWGAFELSYAHFFGVATHYILELSTCKSTRRRLERLQTYTTQLYLSFCKQFGTFVEVLWTCSICLVHSRQGILAKPMTSDTAVESLIKTSPALPIYFLGPPGPRCRRPLEIVSSAAVAVGLVLTLPTASHSCNAAPAARYVSSLRLNVHQCH